MWGNEDRVGNKGVSLWWKDLVKIGRSPYYDPFLSSCCFGPKNGFNTLFWKSKWLTCLILRDEFSAAFEASRLKGVSVAGMDGWVNGEWVWGDLGVSEVVEVGLVVGEERESLRVLLEAYEGWGDGHDVVRWSANGGEDFSVASCYNGYANLRIPFGPPCRFEEAFRIVGKVGVPFKIKAFGWRLLENRLPTKDLLLKRCIPIPLAHLKCAFCGMEPETRDHSFVACNLVKNIWRGIAFWIGKRGIEVNECYSSFMDWRSFCKSIKLEEKKVDLIWLATTWSIWLARNGVCFREEKWSLDDLLWRIKTSVWRRTFCRDITQSNCSFYEFSKEPLFFCRN
ncbi:uncharacterized protein LOC131639261 [Vicia villosa]|uniref:uncharacterized protein LOC131639261 n=1 Tax=Vicia villosa TaxID=3911 RepID=UPI00273CDC13|nr:uncharacterized protein LOC131639261 [Vicia villosa]